MGDGCLNNEHFEELGGILKGKLEEHFKNQELRQGETSLQHFSEQRLLFWEESSLGPVKHHHKTQRRCANSHSSKASDKALTSRFPHDNVPFPVLFFLCLCSVNTRKSVFASSSQNTSLSFTAKRQDEDYDEQVEETLQDEVTIFTPVKESELFMKTLK